MCSTLNPLLAMAPISLRCQVSQAIETCSNHETVLVTRLMGSN